VAGPPLLTDNDVRQPIINALRVRGWDVVRGVDVFGEKNIDEDLLGWAAAEGRVFLTSDDGIHATAPQVAPRGVCLMVYWWLSAAAG
jgi:hypothetical protein